MSDPNAPAPAVDSASPKRTRPALIAAGFVVFLFVAVAAAGILGATTTACVSCHSRQAAAVGSHAHASVTCAACHLWSKGPISGRLDIALRMVPASLAGRDLKGPGVLIGRDACVSCHQDLFDKGRILNRGLRIRHSACAETGLCENCHGDSVHGESTRFVRRYSMNTCVTCHKSKAASLECDTCHDGKLANIRPTDSEWARVHGPQWKTMHGTGDLNACGPCHAADYCKKCHGVAFPHSSDFGETHGGVALASGSKPCLTCHKNQQFCTACHGIEMPHPAGFLKQHSRIASNEVDPKCNRCHVADDCVKCHTYHVHPGGTKPAIGRVGDGSGRR